MTVPMSSASTRPPVRSFVDIFNLVILTHGNSSEGHRDSCCPSVVTTPSRIHLEDHARDGKYIRLPIHKSMGFLVQRTTQGKINTNRKGYSPKWGAASTHTSESKDMSPGRSFFVDTFGIRAGLGYK